MFVAAPLVAPATIAGVCAAVVSVVADRPAELIAWLGALPTLGIARTARVMAEVPGGTMPWPDGVLGALLLAGLTVLAVSGRRDVGAVGFTHLAFAPFAAIQTANATMTPRPTSQVHRPSLTGPSEPRLSPPLFGRAWSAFR